MMIPLTLTGLDRPPNTHEPKPNPKPNQVSVFMLEEYNTVISIQKTPSEINSLLLARIMYAGSKIRLNGPRFLVYAIVDSIVDELFPILRLIRKKVRPSVRPSVFCVASVALRCVRGSGRV